MGMKTDIYNDNRLRFGETSAPFVIKKAEEMRMEIASVPHRHSYYTVLWSFNDEGQHVVDMQTYPFHMQTVFCIMPGQVHCIVPPQPKGIMLLFTPEFLASKVSVGFYAFKRRTTATVGREFRGTDGSRYCYDRCLFLFEFTQT